MPNVYLAVIIGTVFVLGWFFGSWAMMKLHRAAASAHYRAHVFQRRESGLWVWRHHEDCAVCWILDNDDREDGDEVMLRNGRIETVEEEWRRMGAEVLQQALVDIIDERSLPPEESEALHRALVKVQERMVCRSSKA